MPFANLGFAPLAAPLLVAPGTGAVLLGFLVWGFGDVASPTNSLPAVTEVLKTALLYRKTESCSAITGFRVDAETRNKS